MLFILYELYIIIILLYNYKNNDEYGIHKARMGFAFFFSYFKDLQKERVQINNDKVVNIMLNNKTIISHIVIFFIIFF